MANSFRCENVLQAFRSALIKALQILCNPSNRAQRRKLGEILCSPRNIRDTLASIYGPAMNDYLIVIMTDCRIII
jgi:hypothetical protein